MDSNGGQRYARRMQRREFLTGVLAAAVSPALPVPPARRLRTIVYVGECSYWPVVRSAQAAWTNTRGIVVPDGPRQQDDNLHLVPWCASQEPGDALGEAYRNA